MNFAAGALPPLLTTATGRNLPRDPLSVSRDMWKEELRELRRRASLILLCTVPFRLPPPFLVTLPPPRVFLRKECGID
jgi:hypothetical protein